MSRISVINQTIMENFKINSKNEKNIDCINEDTIGEDDSFNQLLSLQMLIQKHSGLKELCNIYSYFLFYIILYL